MRLIYYFDALAIIWHSIVPVFLRIYTDIHRSDHKIVFVIVWCLKLFKNNNKNNFAFICCKFLANLCKSSKILEHCHVKWWLKYRNNRSVSWRLSCNSSERILQERPNAKKFWMLQITNSSDFFTNLWSVWVKQNSYWSKSVFSDLVCIEEDESWNIFTDFDKY